MRPLRVFRTVGDTTSLGEFQNADALDWGGGAAIPSSNDVSLIVHTHTFAEITAKPTTLVGYGITDAAPLVHTHDAADLTVGTLPTGRLAGSYTGITGVGVLTVGTWQGDTIADIYLAALSASKLTGAALPAGIVSSSLTSVGTLTSLTVGAGATALGGTLSVTGAATFASIIRQDRDSGALFHQYVVNGFGESGRTVARNDGAMEWHGDSIHEWHLGGAARMSLTTTALTTTAGISLGSVASPWSAIHATDVVASVIRRATSDGADDQSLILTAGGGSGTDRAASVRIFGNENGNTGQLQFFAGNVAGGHILFHTGAGAERGRITDGGVFVWNSHMTLAPTKRLYFDNSGDTFIVESEANALDFVTANVSRALIDTNDDLVNATSLAVRVNGVVKRVRYGADGSGPGGSGRALFTDT